MFCNSNFIFARCYLYNTARIKMSSIGASKIPDPDKVRLRAEVADRIAKMSSEEKHRQSMIIYEKLINNPLYKNSNRISIYMSTPDEVDTSRIIDHIKSRGAVVFVPQYAGGHMKMLRMENGDEAVMVNTKHGISQHAKNAIRQDALDDGGLDLLLTPGVAFTRSGERLGHGGGYYDRYIAHLFSKSTSDKPKLIALAFKEQIYEQIPTNEQDIVLDEVITAD